MVSKVLEFAKLASRSREFIFFVLLIFVRMITDGINGASKRVNIVSKRDVYTGCTQCVHRLYAMCTLSCSYMFTGCTRCVHRLYAMCTLSCRYMYTGCSRCVHRLYAMCTLSCSYMYTGCMRCVHSLLATCTPAVCDVYTLLQLHVHWMLCAETDPEELCVRHQSEPHLADLIRSGHHPRGEVCIDCYPDDYGRDDYGRLSSDAFSRLVGFLPRGQPRRDATRRDATRRNA